MFIATLFFQEHGHFLYNMKDYVLCVYQCFFFSSKSKHIIKPTQPSQEEKGRAKHNQKTGPDPAAQSANRTKHKRQQEEKRESNRTLPHFLAEKHQKTKLSLQSRLNLDGKSKGSNTTRQNKHVAIFKRAVVCHCYF
jgi:type IV secretory pathway VirB10-like protein